MTAMCRECGNLGPRESEPAPSDDDADEVRFDMTGVGSLSDAVCMALLGVESPLPRHCGAERELLMTTWQEAMGRVAEALDSGDSVAMAAAARPLVDSLDPDVRAAMGHVAEPARSVIAAMAAMLAASAVERRLDIALGLLREIALWRGVYDESIDAARERIAAEFYAESGMLAPGRDYPQAQHPPTDRERREAWDAWCARRNQAIDDRIRAVLGEVPR